MEQKQHAQRSARIDKTLKFISDPPPPPKVEATIEVNSSEVEEVPPPVTYDQNEIDRFAKLVRSPQWSSIIVVTTLLSFAINLSLLLCIRNCTAN